MGVEESPKNGRKSRRISTKPPHQLVRTVYDDLSPPPTPQSSLIYIHEEHFQLCNDVCGGGGGGTVFRFFARRGGRAQLYYVLFETRFIVAVYSRRTNSKVVPSSGHHQKRLLSLPVHRNPRPPQSITGSLLDFDRFFGINARLTDTVKFFTPEPERFVSIPSNRLGYN